MNVILLMKCQNIRDDVKILCDFKEFNIREIHCNRFSKERKIRDEVFIHSRRMIRRNVFSLDIFHSKLCNGIFKYIH